MSSLGHMVRRGCAHHAAKEQELLKREREFSTFRDTRVLVFSWNVDSARPDALAASSDSVGVLEDAVRGADAPDIVVFGFQEVVDLESRRMAAKTVVLAGKKSRSADGKVSERVTGAYKRWFDKLTNVMRLTSPPDDGYTMVSTEHLVGLFTCVFVRTAEMGALTNAHIKLIKRGLHGRYGNKVRLLRSQCCGYIQYCVLGRERLWRDSWLTTHQSVSSTATSPPARAMFASEIGTLRLSSKTSHSFPTVVSRTTHLHM